MDNQIAEFQVGETEKRILSILKASAHQKASRTEIGRNGILRNRSSISIESSILNLQNLGFVRCFQERRSTGRGRSKSMTQLTVTGFNHLLKMRKEDRWL